MRARVLFYVQHLLGIGHLVRAGRVAAALAESFEVLLVVGGERPEGVLPDGVEVLALPPVKAGPAGFSSLVHPDGAPFTAADRAARRDRLLAAFDAFAPAAVLTEAFPFGRRAMRFELLPLLERAAAAAHRPLIACSVRDILQAMNPERRAEALALARERFDLVLVHGDPRLAALSDSFPEAGALGDALVHTGLVGPRGEAPPHGAGPDGEPPFDVVVSVGGGAVGGRLIAAALAARPLTRLGGARWLVLTGPNAEGPAPGAGAPGVAVRRFVPDLAARLARARVSVSQAGYNTVADVLAARCRAVLVPYAAAGETEQGRRAALLAARGLAAVVEEGALTTAALAAAVNRALDLPAPRFAPALDGAERTRAALAARLGPPRAGGAPE